jgi:NAD-dependent SIR2 family protein deacetylase
MDDNDLAPPSPDPATIERAAALISQADALVIAAGAGMGVDSGLPDFRGNAGFWKAYPALATDGVGFMDIASPQAFLADPLRAWGFYGHRLALYRKTTPHAGFDLLRRWGDAMSNGYFVFTSNVDGHFQKAGFNPLRIDECHGSIHYLQCLEPCSQSVWEARTLQPAVDAARCTLLGAPPACPHCGGIARPNILMFEDWRWIDVRREAQSARRQGWLEQARRPVVVEIGAGVNVATVRHFSSRVARQHNGALIRINPRDARVGALPGVGIAAGALEALSAIDALLKS